MRRVLGAVLLKIANRLLMPSSEKARRLHEAQAEARWRAHRRENFRRPTEYRFGGDDLGRTP